MCSSNVSYAIALQVRAVHNRSKCIFKCQVLREDRPTWCLIISNMISHIFLSAGMQLSGKFQRSASRIPHTSLIHHGLWREIQEDSLPHGLVFHLTKLTACIDVENSSDLVCTTTRQTKDFDEEPSCSFPIFKMSD